LTPLDLVSGAVDRPLQVHPRVARALGLLALGLLDLAGDLDLGALLLDLADHRHLAGRAAGALGALRSLGALGAGIALGALAALGAGLALGALRAAGALCSGDARRSVADEGDAGDRDQPHPAERAEGAGRLELDGDALARGAVGAVADVGRARGGVDFDA